MVKLTTGIFAAANDKQSLALLKRLELLQAGAAKLFSFPEEGEPAVCLAADEILWNQTDVSRLDTAFIRGFSYSNPVVPRAMDDTDWSLWQYDYICEQQKTSFLYSALSEMQRRGVNMSNPPGVYLDVSMKMDLLERIRSAGVKVPDLLCTNDRQEADQFASKQENVLWRPVTGRAAWQLCQERQLDALIAADKTPVILASVEPGLFLRCYICNGEPVLCLKYGSPAQIPLERLEVFQVVEETDFYEALRTTCSLMNMQWGVISCTVEDGSASIYDIDADPVLTSLPPQVEEYLTLCLAHRLIGQSAPTAQALFDTALVRSLPFLRRMLTVLFEIETRKYAVL